MRAAFAVAAYLGMTVATLMATLSAQEFTRWQVWMQLHQVGPDWDARHRAELLAAVHNSGRVKHADDRLFTVADFLPPDPWAAPPVPTKPAAALSPEELKAQHAAWLAKQGA